MECNIMKKNIDSFLICGSLFSFIGAVFLILGIIFFFNMDYLLKNGEGNVEILPIIFSGMGFIFFLVGTAILFFKIRKNKLIKKLITDGNYVMAECIGTVFNANIRINGRRPYYVECHYFDSYSGLDYIFRSENIFVNPNIPKGTMIQVYVQENNFKNYYVDISPFTSTHYE